MPRLRVKGGCNTCKDRRKKCPEQRPSCASCVRLGLRCSYGDSADTRRYRSRSIVIASYSIPSPLYQVRQLPVTTFKSGQTEAAIASVPFLLADMFLPTYAYGSHSIHELMQVTLSSTHVSDACVASVMASWHTQAESKDALSLQIWGRALWSMQALLSGADEEENGFVKLIVAIMYLGAIESIGVGFVNDLTLHFEAGTSIIDCLLGNSTFGWSSIPSSLRICILEHFLYQATLCMFLPEQKLRSSCPKLIKIHKLLTELNPPTDFCIDKSPFYAGFYDIYTILFKVVLLHRLSASTDTFQADVDTLEQQTILVQGRVSTTISKSQTANTSDLGRLIQLHNLCCTALIICVNALRPPSDARDSRVAAEIQRGLQILYHIKPSRERAYTLVWPVQVLMCAVSSNINIIEFYTIFDDIRGCFTGSSLTRTEALLRRVIQVRLQPESEAEKQIRLFAEDTTIPRGMLLFRQRGGVLAHEF